MARSSRTDLDRPAGHCARRPTPARGGLAGSRASHLTGPADTLRPVAEQTGWVVSDGLGVPDFVVIGAAKSGTTSLRNYLAQHPELFLPERGEPSFFAHVGSPADFSGPGDDEWTFVTDPDDYVALFSPAEPGQVRGEISPRYLFFEQAAASIAELAPTAKLVAILRHPVDRAYSHYLMNRSRGCEPESSFETAMQLSSRRWSQGWGWDWMYAEAGLYAQQVRRYRSLFDPEQLAVFVYEEWVADPARFFADLFAFLGVDASFRPDTQRRERSGSMPRSAALAALMRKGHGFSDALRVVTPPRVRQFARQAVESVNVKPPEQLDDRLRSDLHDEFFADDVAELETWLGRKIASWSPPHGR